MKTPLLLLTALAVSTGAAFAQDVIGAWQGTLHTPQRDLRIIVKISKGPNGPQGAFYSIDQGAQSLPINAISVQAGLLKFAVPAAGGTYEGKFSNTDNTTIAGNWTQGPNPLPLDLTLANEKTAWAIPEAPPPPTPMVADATPSFEAATIKPSAPDSQGKAIQMRGRNFSTLNTSVVDLMTFAWGIHQDEILNAPAWLASEKFDLAGVPDKPGMPSDKQIKGMMKKLLADRFGLTYHNDKKEMTVLALTVGKTGPKMTKSTGDPNGLPGLGFRGLGNMVVRNANMSDFIGTLQSAVLSRPVIDQTELAGRFDFTLVWTPDETQFGGRGGQAPPPAAGTTAPPDLFNALADQLGLKLASTKAQVDVLVIDHVAKPSDN